MENKDGFFYMFYKANCVALVVSLNHIMPTLLPGLGPRFLGTLTGSSSLHG